MLLWKLTSSAAACLRHQDWRRRVEISSLRWELSPSYSTENCVPSKVSRVTAVLSQKGRAAQPLSGMLWARARNWRITEPWAKTAMVRPALATAIWRRAASKRAAAIWKVSPSGAMSTSMALTIRPSRLMREASGVSTVSPVAAAPT